MPARRPGRAARRAAVLALLLATAAGCGDAGELEGAGATPTAVGPARLWPELTPASSPAFEIGEVNTEPVKGVTVPHDDDIRKVDPVRIVRAEIAAHAGDYDGDKAPYRDTARRMADCRKGPGHGRCPVLRPYYRDLTGDGRDDLTLGFPLLPGKTTAVRVYTVEKHRLMQVMAWEDALSGVELAGRSLVIRSPSEVAGYEYRLQWTWDREERAMLLTHDEMLRTGSRKHSRHPSASSSASSSASPSASPSASAG
ncbi:lipoprotein [Streptomyces venetus]|uniref:Lipoprotein n=1 Tax=Streptomyces venetus TaxID=1701086 RepID=A0ABP8F7V9_9ACTN